MLVHFDYIECHLWTLTVLYAGSIHKPSCEVWVYKLAQCTNIDDLGIFFSNPTLGTREL